MSGLGLQQFRTLPPEFMKALLAMVAPHSVTSVFSLLVPLVVFLAGVLLSVSVVVRSFKEAQSLAWRLLVAVLLEWRQATRGEAYRRDRPHPSAQRGPGHEGGHRRGNQRPIARYGVSGHGSHRGGKLVAVHQGF